MLKRVLGYAKVYSSFGDLIGAKHARATYVSEHVRPEPGMKILDIGCGPGDILDFLPQVDYHGFDPSREYIEAAQRRFKGRGTFYVGSIGAPLEKSFSDFDLVLASGVVHHLDDAQARELFRLASSALKTGGRLVTFDGVFVEGQSFFARWMLRNDRGRYVRDEASYVALARKWFPQVISRVRTDLLRIPYTHLILECSK
jgi:cyclopropane fatty-acyl-phospholipid synthase-like methyltransferase